MYKRQCVENAVVLNERAILLVFEGASCALNLIASKLSIEVHLVRLSPLSLILSQSPKKMVLTAKLI